MSRHHPLVLFLLLCLAGCSTPGAFFSASDGPLFTPRTLGDEDHALVYIYRPQSDWADQELEAPGIFLNKNLIGSLPSNSYLVLEFEVASYPLEMRRPLFGTFWTALADGMLDFNRIAGFNLDVGAGGTPTTCATTSSTHHRFRRARQPWVMGRCNWCRPAWPRKKSPPPMSFSRRSSSLPTGSG